MKKLRIEDLKKSQVFNKPPEGYFDRLPGIIQSKTAHKSTNRSIPLFWVRTLRLVPVAALLVFIALYSGVLSFDQSNTGFEEMLSEVSTEDIIIYLEELDISNDEILEEFDINALSLEFENVSDPLIDNLDLEDETLLQLYDDLDLQDSLL